MFLKQFCSALDIIHSRLLPALCVGKFINWCSFNMFNILVKLPASALSGQFHTN